MQIVDEYAVQEFMNEIKTLLRRAHASSSRLILYSAAPRVRNSGFFESRKNEGVHELGDASIGWPAAIDRVELSATRTCRRSLGIFRAYDGADFRTILCSQADAEKLSRKNICRAENSRGGTVMDTNTLLIILVVIFLCGGFGFYGRGRWF